jgi:signal transduction histidine kinase
MDAPRSLPPPPPDAPGADAGRRLARAERVLACFQKALGHDLPGQVVALQGLLQVLAMEEGGRLGGDGQDYLRRLAAVAGRLQDTLATLKAIGRAAADAGVAEEVALADVAHEATAEVKQIFPGRAVTCDLRFQAPAVKTYRRPMQRALVELIRTLVPEGDGAAVHLRLGSRPTPDGVELSVGNGGSATAWAAGDPLRLALVRELVDACGGVLTFTEEPGQGKLFTILVRPPA